MWVISRAFIQLRPDGDVISKHRPAGIKGIAAGGTGKEGESAEVLCTDDGYCAREKGEPAEALCTGDSWCAREEGELVEAVYTCGAWYVGERRIAQRRGRDRRGSGSQHGQQQTQT